MIVRLCLVLCLAAHLGSNAEVILKNGTYHDLLISFSPNVDAKNGKLIVDSLKNLLESTSQVLHTAIGQRVASVTFHLPPTWDTSTWEGVTPAAAISVGEEDILVDDIEDSAFGNQPLALQYGGCGVPAHSISIPVEFLNSSEGYPKGKLLAREWLKYRYGVFDENGFDGDDMYPSYYQIPGAVGAKITECTHPEVKYFFKGTNNSNCSLDVPFATADNCEIHPKEEFAANVTSSLMYFHPELPNVESVCGKEHPHKDSTPSKQNILCSGSSIWEVLERSGDFTVTNTTDGPPASDKGIQFSYSQETKPIVVIAFENSEKLHDQKQIILFAIRKFMYDLPDDSEFGLYSFDNQHSVIRPLSKLISEADRDVTIVADFNWESEVCPTCALWEAVQEKPLYRSSIILIVGSNSSNINVTLVEKLKELNLCLTIIAFTSEGNKATGYDELLSSSSCNSLLEISKEYTDELLFDELFYGLQRNMPQPHSKTRTVKVSTGPMFNNDPLEILTDTTAGKYTLWTEKPLGIKGIECKAEDNDVNLKQGVLSSSIASYTFDPVEKDVKCKLKFKNPSEVFTRIEMTTKDGAFFDGKVWIHDTSDSEEQMPIIIYAQINFGSYPIQDARVVATVLGPNGEKEKLVLLDNGRGNPDITQHDGIYSRYFVDFVSEGQYLVLVTVDDDAGKAKVGRKGQDHCCGSKVKSSQEQALFFIKSFKTSFISKKKAEGGFKPSRILDLKVSRFDPANSIVLKWTAPGGEADKGNAKAYILKSFTSREDIFQNFDKGSPLNVTIDPHANGTVEEFEIRFDNFQRNTGYYLTMQSVNEHGKVSDVSNIVEFFLPEDTDVTKIEVTTDPSLKDNTQSGVTKTTIGIIIGVLCGVIVIIVAVYLFVYFFVKRPKRKEAQKTRTSSNINTTSPPISLNSIPADVILKHHNEVVSAKNQHKNPPIFKEENLESIDLAADSPRYGDRDDNSQRNNVEYSQVHKRQPEHARTPEIPPKSPKRMTNV